MFQNMAVVWPSKEPWSVTPGTVWLIMGAMSGSATFRLEIREDSDGSWPRGGKYVRKRRESQPQNLTGCTGLLKITELCQLGTQCF